MELFIGIMQLLEIARDVFFSPFFVSSLQFPHLPLSCRLFLSSTRLLLDTFGPARSFTLELPTVIKSVKLMTVFNQAHPKAQQARENYHSEEEYKLKI